MLLFNKEEAKKVVASVMFVQFPVIAEMVCWTFQRFQMSRKLASFMMSNFTSFLILNPTFLPIILGDISHNHMQWR